MPVATLWSRMAASAARCWTGVWVRFGQSRLRWVLIQTPRSSRLGDTVWTSACAKDATSNEAAAASKSFFMLCVFCEVERTRADAPVAVPRRLSKRPGVAIFLRGYACQIGPTNEIAGVLHNLYV
jgi:hypothetical protein